jgi:tetratricopeptide (TPR) repeat protein
VLAVSPIPASLVSAVFSEADNMDEPSGKRRARIAISQAEKLSLAERTEDEPGARTVHTLVSRTVRFCDPLPERSERLKAAAVSALTAGLSIIADRQIHNELILIIAHAGELVSRGEDISSANLMGWVARYDHLRGSYKSAEMLLRREQDIRTRLLGAEHPNTLTTMNNLAETLRAQGDFEGARKLHEQVLEIRRRILGAEHPNTLTTMNNLAATLSSQGDFEGARKLHEQVLEITRRILGAEHPNTSISAWNLFLALLEMGNPADALDILKKHLLWLLDRDTASLEANQQKIRDMIIQTFCNNKLYFR